MVVLEGWKMSWKGNLIYSGNVEETNVCSMGLIWIMDPWSICGFKLLNTFKLTGSQGPKTGKELWSHSLPKCKWTQNTQW